MNEISETYYDNKWEFCESKINITLGKVHEEIKNYIFINKNIEIINKDEILISTYILNYIPMKFTVYQINNF